MNGRLVGRVHKALRQHLGMRQLDVSAASGVSRNQISAFENGDLSSISAGQLEACFGALDARLEYRVVRRGADLDRLLDDGHAQLVGLVGRLLRGLGWLFEAEATFSIYGDRGSIDLLAWHPGSRALLVVEIKTELGSIEGLLRPLDVKVRHAPAIARERFGWQSVSVSRLVVLPEGRTVRRQVERHAALLDAVLPARSIAARRWLRQPVGILAGLWFLSAASDAGVTRNPSSIRRVRRRPTTGN